jgi:hypothetical protein
MQVTSYHLSNTLSSAASDLLPHKSPLVTAPTPSTVPQETSYNLPHALCGAARDLLPPLPHPQRCRKRPPTTCLTPSAVPQETSYHLSHALSGVARDLLQPVSRPQRCRKRPRTTCLTPPAITAVTLHAVSGAARDLLPPISHPQRCRKRPPITCLTPSATMVVTLPLDCLNTNRLYMVRVYSFLFVLPNVPHQQESTKIPKWLLVIGHIIISTKRDAGLCHITWCGLLIFNTSTYDR